MNQEPEIDFEKSMLRIALENNALLKTILHYQELAEARNQNTDISNIEEYSDALLSQNLEQAMDLLVEENGNC